jgi:redox-sensitive bicupin YhaK (pirin superfamily)
MIEQVLSARRRDLGGFEVGRVLPAGQRRMVGPFVFFDHIGPAQLTAGIPRSMDVRPHPHIGLSTVTYLFAGEIMHRDSLASEQPIRPGEVNWMTAGRGITHSERFERARAEGGPLHGIQAWVALPEADEEVAPSFTHHAEDSLPSWQADGLHARLVLGELHGLRSPVATHSPTLYLHWQLQPGSRTALPAGYRERAVFIAAGTVEIDGQRFDAGSMPLLTPGQPAQIEALTAATVIVLGGEPLGERHVEWNFVSSSRERIQQAKADWRAGRMKLPDLDHDEFIPLPDTPPPPEPMS